MLLELRCFLESVVTVGPYSAVLLQWLLEIPGPTLLLKARPIRILDTLVCLENCVGSPAWDAVKLTMKVGFICPFVVIDPTIFNQSPTQNTCPFTDVTKLVCASACGWVLVTLVWIQCSAKIKCSPRIQLQCYNLNIFLLKTCLWQSGAERIFIMNIWISLFWSTWNHASGSD